MLSYCGMENSNLLRRGMKKSEHLYRPKKCFPKIKKNISYSKIAFSRLFDFKN